MTHPVRIAIAGAGGSIAYSLVFRIAAGAIFGHDAHVSLSLLDSEPAFATLEALEMELKDCAYPLLADVQIATEPLDAFCAADWVILLRGRSWPQKSPDRLALLRESGPFFVEYGQAISEVAPTARVLVVANPCNSNCLIAKSHAANVPSEHWFALTKLDRMRAVSLIAEKAGVPCTQVKRVIAWGNHSESVFIDFHNALINGRPAPEVVPDENWVHTVLEPTVAHRTSSIMKKHEISPAGSAAQAILSTIRAIMTPTPYQMCFCAAVASDGSYGVPHGLVFGFPLWTEDGYNWSIEQGLYHDGHARERLAVNIAELEHEAATVSNLIGRRT